MKKLYILLCLALIPLMGLSQKVITVDNRPNSGADYTTVGEAHDNAIPGDTIQIHPSVTSYGSITVRKRLIIVGMGHNPANSADNEEATLGTITIRDAAANTIVTGLRFSTVNTSTHTDISGVSIVNNYITTSVVGNSAITAQNWVIEGNFFDSGQVNSNNAQGMIVKNNLFDNTTYAMANFNNTSSFLNNIVINTSNNFANSCTDPIVNNNIFILTDAGDDTIGLNASTVTFNNCLTYNVNNAINPLSGNNNLDNTDPQFVNAPWLTIDDIYNNDYSLDVGSPAINAGTDGTDLGLFGANFTFDNNGRPDLWPYMTSLNITNSSVPMGQDINVEFTASKKN